MIKSEGGGFIEPNDKNIVDMSENAVSVDESQEEQGQPEGGAVM